MKTKIFFLLLIPFIVMGIPQDAFAEMMGMSLTAEASEGSKIIHVRGQVASQVTDITFTVTSPDGFNRLAVDQITPDANGNFVTFFEIKPIWNQNGFYTITAMQSVNENSLYTMAVEVEVINGKAVETLVTESNLETGVFVPDEEQLTREGLTLFANAIKGSTTIEVIGFSDRTNLDITLKVILPNGNVLSTEQITPNLDGKFTRDITTGGPLWNQDGTYTITAQQGESSEYKDSENVEIVDGMVWDDSNPVPPIDPPSDESQISSTDKGTLDVKLTFDEIKPYTQNIINIDFINPQTQKIQEHIDYIVSASNDRGFVFGPIPLTHTSTGSVRIPIEFNQNGVYTIDVKVEGILFQPIPQERASFDIIVGGSEPTQKIPDWVKNTMKWFVEGKISEDEMINALQFLIREGIIRV